MNLRVRRLGPLTIGMLAVALVVPALAGATLFKGSFDHGDKQMRLIVGHSKNPKKLVFRNWRADCKHHDGYFFREPTTFLRPFDRATLRFIHDRDTSIEKANGFRSKFHAGLTGKRTSPNRWAGTFRMNVDVRTGGHYWDDCDMGTVHWVAKRVNRKAGH